jgi:hypothetical protein
MKAAKILVLLFCLSPLLSFAQSDSIPLNQDAVFRRPFIQETTARTALGGYLEANTNYLFEEGVAEGFSMEMRRFNLFLFSSINSRIKFLSELEFEHGTKEISLESAFLDFKMSSNLTFRAGILLPAIGIFNANHDSPNWEFVERPISSTRLIPSTLSEVGFGIHGAAYRKNFVFAYQAYVVNGLRDEVTQNQEGKTSMSSGKSGEMFAHDNNGVPMYNTRLAIGNYKYGEIGLAYYGGTYNTFIIEDLEIDEKRRLHLLSFDYDLNVKKLNIQGEYVFAQVDVRSELKPLYASNQKAGFVDFIYPIIQKKILRFPKARVNASIRLESYDLNIGTFASTQSNIGDEGWRVGFGLGFRPSPGTIFRINYHFSQENDFLSNPASKAGGYQVGVASYF